VVATGDFDEEAWRGVVYGEYSFARCAVRCACELGETSGGCSDSLRDEEASAFVCVALDLYQSTRASVPDRPSDGEQQDPEDDGPGECLDLRSVFGLQHRQIPVVLQ
jgi:hypothetical protein